MLLADVGWVTDGDSEPGVGLGGVAEGDVAAPSARVVKLGDRAPTRQGPSLAGVSPFPTYPSEPVVTEIHPLPPPECSRARMARRLAVLNTGLDVRDRLADVRAPCLVSCRAEDAWLSPDNSRSLAEQNPGRGCLSFPESTTIRRSGRRHPRGGGESVSASSSSRRCPPSPDRSVGSRPNRVGTGPRPGTCRCQR